MAAAQRQRRLSLMGCGAQARAVAWFVAAGCTFGVCAGAAESARPGACEAELEETKVACRTAERVERVEVEADRIPVDTTVAFTEIDGAELQQRGWDLAELLRRVPGARVRDYGGLGSFATLSLRASTAEQVRVLVDGVPLNSSWGGGVDLGRLPTARIESLRVYRGFAPAGLGLAGIGGTIDIRTRKPDPGGAGSAELLTGELGTLRIAAESSIPAGGGAIDFGVEGLDGDGDFRFLDDGGTPFDPGDDRVRHRRNQRLEQRAIWFRTEADRWFTTLRASIQRRGLEPPIFRADPSARTIDRSIAGSVGRRFQRSILRADLRVDRDRFDDSAGDFLFPQRRRSRTRSLDIAWNADRGSAKLPWNLRVEAGVERIGLRDDLIDLDDRGGAERLRAAASAESVQVRGRWTLAPSLRVDAVRDDFLPGSGGTIPPPAADVDRLDASGKIGVRRAVGGRQHWFAGFGRTFRRPNLLELFGDRGAVRGSPDLKAESAWGAEFGWQHRSDDRRWSGSWVGFVRRTEDMIRFVPASQGVSVARNLAEVRVHGIEVEARWAPSRSLSAELSLTRQRSRERTAAGAPFRRLVYQPDWLGSLQLRAERGRIRAHWDIAYTGENSTDTLDTPSLRIGERWIHDAAAIVTLGRGFSLSADVRNLFDRRTLDVLRYPLPGRVALVGIRWSDRT